MGFLQCNQLNLNFWSDKLFQFARPNICQTFIQLSTDRRHSCRERREGISFQFYFTPDMYSLTCQKICTTNILFKSRREMEDTFCLAATFSTYRFIHISSFSKEGNWVVMVLSFISYFLAFQKQPCPIKLFSKCFHSHTLILFL